MMDIHTTVLMTSTTTITTAVAIVIAITIVIALTAVIILSLGAFVFHRTVFGASVLFLSHPPALRGTHHLHKLATLTIFTIVLVPITTSGVILFRLAACIIR